VIDFSSTGTAEDPLRVPIVMDLTPLKQRDKVFFLDTEKKNRSQTKRDASFPRLDGLTTLRMKEKSIAHRCFAPSR